MPPDKPKPPLRFRRLRIAWSVFSGLACVLLMVLWVRSYSVRHDVYHLGTAKITGLNADCGGFSFYTGVRPFYGTLKPAATEPVWQHGSCKPSSIASGFQWKKTRLTTISVPAWFPVLLSATFPALPWIRHPKWRFSLRTLIIATTLVAVVLGLAVYVASK
jgi:hypothetical protein